MAFDSAGDLYAPEYSGISGNVTATLYGDSLSYWGLSGSQTGTSYTSGYSALTTGYVLCSGCSAITAALHNNAPFGVATDSSGNAWVTAAGPIGEALNGGTNTGLSVGLAKCTSGTSCSSIANGNFVSPKRLQVDGNGVIWIMDAYGVHAYASTLSTPAFISEETSASNGSAGFAPCIPSTTTCTYPDNLGTINSGATGSYAYSGAKSVAIDSTGSVWWTTPDTTVGNTNANMLIQMIGTAAPTWPLLAKQTPGTMPQ